ncbi:hypothetical protein [Methylocaldum sp.]|uniref:hypothetical protein n=1 Tax=Methylocaldum sp. TaxID=1969727 RepID=UPI002D59089B|nr:hypothetical protein [Methylocaldum sp.]HYE38189.1 hypothetical protein [Methylocaldum sp.]
MTPLVQFMGDRRPRPAWLRDLQAAASFFPAALEDCVHLTHALGHRFIRYGVVVLLPGFAAIAFIAIALGGLAVLVGGGS